MRIVVASNNKGKLSEIRSILGDKYDIVSLSDIGLDIDIEETGTTFEANAMLKAKAVFDLSGIATLADDSGLEVEFLGGKPGVYSARYAGDHSDQANIDKLLNELVGVEDRRARFVSAVVLYSGADNIISVRGVTSGKILTSREGCGGFGYDPIFFSDDLGKSFGLASEDEKNSVSHRGRALSALCDQLEKSTHIIN